MTCPVCGHSVIETLHEQRVARALYGPPIPYRARVDTCPNCYESGDFEGKNDRVIQAAYDLSAHRSVPAMVERLAPLSCSRPYIERVTGLPQGSIARCEEGAYDAAVIVALQMACVCPSILRLLEDAKFPTKHG
jgi:hypothetical protein